MNDVYQGAILNVAATAARDGRTGLFYDRNAREMEPFQIHAAWPGPGAINNTVSGPIESFICSRLRRADGLIDMAPLNRRAWVMQERLVSRRIVHCTSTQLYWECFESFVSEVHRDKLPLERADHPASTPRSLKLLLETPLEVDDGQSKSITIQDKGSLYRAWSTFVFWYSRCALTYQQDRFVAFAGIARQLEDRLQDKLIAGLWQSQFVDGMCWYQSNKVHSDQPEALADEPWIAPSWSWASQKGGVVYSGRGLVELNEEAQIVHVDTQTKRSGALLSAILQLRCRLIPAMIHNDSREILVRSDDGTWDSLDFRWTVDHSCLEEGQHDVFLVLLQRGLWFFSASDEPWNAVRGLLLVSSAVEDVTFRRAGIFDRIWSVGALPDPPAVHFAATEEQVITIV